MVELLKMKAKGERNLPHPRSYTPPPTPPSFLSLTFLFSIFLSFKQSQVYRFLGDMP
jgi:hypothetical protein